MLCCLLAQGKKINLENLNFKENGEQLRLLLGHEFFPHLPTRELFLNHFSNLHFYVQELSFLACCTFMPCSTFYIYFFFFSKKLNCRSLGRSSIFPSWKIHLIENFIIIATANNITRLERCAWEFEQIIAFLRFSSSSLQEWKSFYFQVRESFRLNLLIFIMQVVQLKAVSGKGLEFLRVEWENKSALRI